VIIGVDIGGTFTDFVAVDVATGRQIHHKVSSTPDSPSRAVLSGLLDIGIDLRDVERLIHGTTVATNTIIQRKGAVTGFITSPGHRDILQIRRGTKPESSVFDLLWDEPEPLVPRYLRVDIDERVDSRGHVIRPLDSAELALAVDHLASHGVESIAICFLFSYLNSDHERRAAEFIAANHPELQVSISSEILPQWREYERASTTVADAYIKPVMGSYIDALAASLGENGFSHDLLIMKSNGGVMTSRAARRRPVETFLSGPAGGVVASKYHGLQAGVNNLITIDMGGTSFDVSLITDGGFSTSSQGWIDECTPLNVAMLDIRTIGAGGGSIAWIDRGRALKVGPRSAGADPGPACYGRGGTEPTITDANVVLGRIGARALLGGRLEIDPALAAEAIERTIAKPLRLDTVEAAAGIIRICVANMAGEIRAITAERGVNPRQFAILAGGGGGPLHAAQLAREFEIETIVVPSYPGLLSAGGLVASDLRVDRIKSFPTRIERDGIAELSAAATALLAEVTAELEREGYKERPVTALSLDMKYSGQNWDINIPVEIDDFNVVTLSRLFDERHNQLYGFDLPNHRHDVLSIRASAIGPTQDAEALLPRRFAPGAPRTTETEPEARRAIWDDAAGGFVDGAVYERDALPPGSAVVGACLIEGMDSTVWVPSDASGVVDANGNIIVSLSHLRTMPLHPTSRAATGGT
jgi:N-methylhydantoinase A